MVMKIYIYYTYIFFLFGPASPQSVKYESPTTNLVDDRGWSPGQRPSLLQLQACVKVPDTAQANSAQDALRRARVCANLDVQSFVSEVGGHAANTQRERARLDNRQKLRLS